MRWAESRILICINAPPDWMPTLRPRGHTSNTCCCAIIRCVFARVSARRFGRGASSTEGLICAEREMNSRFSKAISTRVASAVFVLVLSSRSPPPQEGGERVGVFARCVRTRVSSGNRLRGRSCIKRRIACARGKSPAARALTFDDEIVASSALDTHCNPPRVTNNARLLLQQ